MNNWEELLLKNQINESIIIEVVEFINSINKTIISILEIDKWDVHSVYKISTNDKNYYLKIRNNFCRRYNNIIIEPKDIEREKLALDLLHNLFPVNFPKVLLFNSSKNYFLMWDIVNCWIYFIDFLNSLYTEEKLEDNIIKLGKILWNTHVQLSTLETLNNFSSDKYYSRLWIIFWGNNCTVSIIEELKKEKQQFILWDLSPKNIWFNEKNIPVFFDLEYFSKWNCVFDVAFLLSHIYLHLFGSKLNEKLINIFLKSYMNINKNFEVNDLFWRVFYWTLIYRVWVFPMKYDVNLNLDDINKINDISEQYLNKFYFK